MEISSRDSGVHVGSLYGVSAVCRGEMGIWAMAGRRVGPEEEALCMATLCVANPMTGHLNTHVHT